MKTLFTLMLFSITFSLVAQNNSTNIFFNVDSDVMRINDLYKLQKFIEEKRTIKLIGHADKSGNAEYNLDLSKRRVENVKKYLVSQGYPAEKIATDYQGESNAGSKEHFFNRRVEVIYNTPNKTLNSFEDFKKSLVPAVQTFWIHTSGDTTIEGEKGTIVTLASSAMITADGTIPSGKIKVELTEYTSNSDYFADDLYTQSGQELIETNGMIKIEAFSGEDKLEMQSGSTIEIGFPKTSTKEFTNFNGERLANGTMNWTNTAIQKDFKLVLDGSDKVKLTTGQGSMGRTYPYQLFRTGDTTGMAKFFQEQEKIEQFKNNYYDVIESNKLDFINCDRFLRDKGRELYMTRFDVSISNKQIKLMAVNIIFNEIKSILEVYDYKEGFEQSNRFIEMAIPDKADVTIMAIGQNEETKEVYFFKESANITEDYIKTVTLVKTSYEEIKKQLD